jgi:hypothetical protein
MNNRTAESAFFSPRVLIGLFIVLAGVFLALAGLGVFSALAQVRQQQRIVTDSKDPLVPNGFDCSKIHELGIDKQENMRARAIMIACGLSQRGIPFRGSSASKFVRKLMAPASYGGLDVDLITGPETWPHVTQSTTFSTANPDNPNQIVVAYNDSSQAPSSYSAAAVSTDGGTTFTDLHIFPNTFGDPVVLYNKSNVTWYTIWIDGNAGCTLGGFKSTDPLNPASWTHFCVHSGISDDRESGWVDNNASSPHYGNMYVSWNDFGTACGAGGCLFATFSSDGGATWSSPVEVQTNSSIFIRNVQITGDLVTGDIYIAGIDEGGGGFPHNDTNYFFRSTDGGNTWTQTYVGTPYPGPGVTGGGYFACMFPDNGCFWLREGGGEPAALNGVVHYVYDQHGTGDDPADVYYIRSTDRGVTFSAPVKLNTDMTSRPNWEPNLSVSPSGTLFAVWYDARETTSCTLGDPTVPCYRMWARKSNDNGVTWLADMPFSDVVSPLPAEPDGGTGASDYDYGSAVATKHVSSWVDGRVTINGVSQQDVFFDSESSVARTPRPTPTPRPRPTPGPRP